MFVVKSSSTVYHKCSLLHRNLNTALNWETKWRAIWLLIAFGAQHLPTTVWIGPPPPDTVLTTTSNAHIPKLHSLTTVPVYVLALAIAILVWPAPLKTWVSTFDKILFYIFIIVFKNRRFWRKRFFFATISHLPMELTWSAVLSCQFFSISALWSFSSQLQWLSHA